MWLLLARVPRPDVAYWPGRRQLAAVDAVFWPAVWMALVACLPGQGGIVGALIVAWAIVAGWRRLQHALWHNHRYRFTSWRWGGLLAWLLVIGWALRWTLFR